jgi:chromosome segregation ATPase
MSDNTTLLRTTTIGLDEYNRLNESVNTQRALVGALEQQIENLKEEIIKVEEKQPQVKVTHLVNEWNDYDDALYPKVNKVEFLNLPDVVSLANNTAKSIVKEKIDELESKLEVEEKSYKQLQKRFDDAKDLIDYKNRELNKIKIKYDQEVTDAKEEYTKNVSTLKKAYSEDVDAYKETIKDLKEEVKKVKDSKTDEEVEKKRNQEIVDLKLRIRDLEKLIKELSNMNFFKRTFKLRSISTERLAAQKELIEREKKVNLIGTTWVKENGKYQTYDAFRNALHNVIPGVQSMYQSVYGWISNANIW